MSESEKARSGRWYLHREIDTRSLEIVPVALVDCDATRSILSSRILNFLLLAGVDISNSTIFALVSTLMAFSRLLVQSTYTICAGRCCRYKPCMWQGRMSFAPKRGRAHFCTQAPLHLTCSYGATSFHPLCPHIAMSFVGGHVTKRVCTRSQHGQGGFPYVTPQAKPDGARCRIKSMHT